MNIEKEAEYRCLNCGCEWREKRTSVECRMCGGISIKWINYEKDFEFKK